MRGNSHFLFGFSLPQFFFIPIFSKTKNFLYLQNVRAETNGGAVLNSGHYVPHRLFITPYTTCAPTRTEFFCSIYDICLTLMFTFKAQLGDIGALGKRTTYSNFNLPNLPLQNFVQIYYKEYGKCCCHVL